MAISSPADAMIFALQKKYADEQQAQANNNALAMMRMRLRHDPGFQRCARCGGCVSQATATVVLDAPGEAVIVHHDCPEEAAP